MGLGLFGNLHFSRAHPLFDIPPPQTHAGTAPVPAAFRRRREPFVTGTRDALKIVKEQHSVTLSLSIPLMRKFRVYAAERNQSMTSLMEEAIVKLMDQQTQRDAARRRFLERARNAPARGTGGKVTWTRDEIHERRVY